MSASPIYIFLCALPPSIGAVSGIWPHPQFISASGPSLAVSRHLDFVVGVDGTGLASDLLSRIIDRYSAQLKRTDSEDDLISSLRRIIIRAFQISTTRASTSTRATTTP